MGLEFQERLELLSKTVGNASVLAKMAGVSRRTLSLYMAGKIDPSRRRLINLAKAAGVHVEWLATGRGPMKGSVSYLDEDFIRIPFVSPDGEFRSTVAVGKCFLNGSLGSSVDDLILVKCPDHSMEPTIECHDTILVDQSLRKITPYNIYCLRVEKEFLFRRVVFYPHENTVTLHCDRYQCQKTFNMDEMSQLEIIGQALYAVKKIK